MSAEYAGQSLAPERRAIGAFGDRIFHGVTAVSALIVLALIMGIAVSLVIGAWPALSKFGWHFVVSSEWNPVTDDYGALVAIFGTLVSSALAMLIAVPVSFGIALFITELAPLWMRRPISTAIELLAAIPSIIYGMWGLFVFAPFLSDYVQPWLNDAFGDVPIVGYLFSGPPIGIGVFTAGLVLAVMVIPFITAVMRDTFEVVPSVLKESSYALGATTWEVARSVILPYTKTGVIGGIMLGLGRALGETMAVTFVIGNSHSIPNGLFYPGNSISATLANEFTEATGELYTSALIALGLVLFVITLIVLVLARLLLLRLSAQEGR
ncbi:phosphate ABC transporter permease subunit PstC [Salinisphaera sp. Q1T1-3]|uniref:phosphate ABC transporter permease subunit PstC n=1 Tax=Salinisphaera sp. Q1T1-3 TaxID=2321229 RepID=UPI000E746A7F|nr:phosphate ABC transporter permease subunit PstC [Salinisphaera sp. Q1T1-3]RJS95047.1 phosphate ABC transporter permease subunit PstC [Salinisphaera sp. Q1T1-3]